ncbi:MAG: DNA polymerase III subunit gamma/tau [Chlorobi bacterium]|nr:DNA polymerase III subunit gamma/tau [Chlorobiota bacterium]
MNSTARKYRPTKFSDVVAQEHITTALRNAVKTGRIPQSLLFCGPRGVGKTTCARILAKAINCENPVDGEPCGECPSCKRFAENASLNVFELDAASNNSVDDIRNLIEQVRFPPAEGKYKVYIIDEVHMLSTSAFNAFLKTLEEPPEYAVFILATTEKHKILPTIISRCQVYDFRRIPVSKIIERLKYVASEEGIEVEEEALFTIAEYADGALRDALTLFDRLISYSGNKLTYKDVTEALHILDYNTFFEVVERIMIQDIPQLLKMWKDISNAGFNSEEFLHGLARHLRNLLYLKTDTGAELLDVPESWRDHLKRQAEKISPSYLTSALLTINRYENSLTFASDKYLTTELALMELATLPSITPRQARPTEKKTLTVQTTESPAKQHTPQNQIRGRKQGTEETKSTNKPAPSLTKESHLSQDPTGAIIQNFIKWLKANKNSESMRVLNYLSGTVNKPLENGKVVIEVEDIYNKTKSLFSNWLSQNRQYENVTFEDLFVVISVSKGTPDAKTQNVNNTIHQRLTSEFPQTKDFIKILKLHGSS